MMKPTAAIERPDAELLKRAAAGDGESFASLVERHYGLAYSVARARLDDAEAVEDLVQEVFLRAFLYAPKLGNPARFPTWLACVTRNMAINWQKSDQRRSNITKTLPLELAAGVPDHAKGARETMNDHQRNQLLEEALRTLDEDERELVLLHYAQGWPKRRIAKELGLHAATVGRKIDRVLDKLKGRLETTLRTEAPKMIASPARTKQTAALILAVAAMPALQRGALAAQLAAETQALAAAGGTAAVAGVAGGFSVMKMVLAAAAAVVLAIGGITVMTANGKATQAAAQVIPPNNMSAVDAQAPLANEEEMFARNGAGGTRAEQSATVKAAIPFVLPKGGQATEALGGDERASTHLSTDKPIYRIGETVYLRAVSIDALTRHPLAQGHPRFEIVSPQGSSITSGMAQIGDGVSGWSWLVPEDAAGGQYIARVKFDVEGYAPSERKFEVRAFRASRARTQIEFLREGYGPSDEVTATMKVTRSEGGVPAGAPVTMTARVDEIECWRSETTVNEQGVVTAHFTLPETIVEGNGTLTFVIQDGGVVETAAKSIPILLSHVDLAVYPEGGYLVPGVENRVYFEATAPNGRPADIVAELVDAAGAVILQTRAEHEGRGRFVFTPKLGEAYKLRVTEPWTVTTEVPLGEMQADGVVLRAAADRFDANAPVVIQVGAQRAYNISVTASLREKEIARVRTSISKGIKDVMLPLPEGACGVLRVTASDMATGLPLAERLIYREPGNNVSVEIVPDKEFYAPGSPVTLTMRTRDENGNPAPSFVGLTVTDDATLELIEDRQKAPRLPVQVYLENDVRELADAQIYLGNDEEAPLALDLLLGTQGWRRFAFVDAEKFKSEHGDAARRVLADINDHRADLSMNRNDQPFWGAQDDGLSEFKIKDTWGKLYLADEFVFEGLAIHDVGLDAAKEPLKELQPGQAAGTKKVFTFDSTNGTISDGDVWRVRNGSTHYYPVKIIREYAHSTRANRDENDRSDFTETVYWSAATKTDENGEAKVQFSLSDSVTSFRALADAWTGEGAFGTGENVIESRRPFYVEIKTPLEVSTGDHIQLPISIVNDTDDDLTAALALTLSTGMTVGDYPQSVDLPAHSRQRIIIPIEVTSDSAEQEILVTASSGTMTDHVTRKFPAKAVGFPTRISRSGILEDNITHRFAIPDSMMPQGMSAKVELYPSPVANLTSALEALIRDPNGCFEQTSSTNYPLVMAMQYFSTHSGIDPSLVASSREKLDAGYKRLIGFETSDKGFEWFGQNPPHEALTAYGLLEFNDMRSIYAVDPSMIERTREWLLSRRDGNGGFKRSDKAIDSFGRAPEDVTNAYIVWALTAAGEKEIAKELDAVATGAQESNDAYVIALAAGALQNAGRGEEARPLLKRLAAMQNEDGSIDKANTSITGSSGNSLVLEATSLAVLAWLHDSTYAGNVEKAMQCIASRCEGGAFGSTQSTVLALKAIIEYDKARAAERRGGTIVLIVNGREAEQLSYKGDRTDAIVFDQFAANLARGEQTIELRLADGSPLPYSMTIDFFAATPANDDECPLAWDVVAAANNAQEGEALEVIATIENKTDKGLPMTMAIVGLPGGLEPRHDQLKELVEEGAIAFYEVIGRSVVLYWRDMAPNTRMRITISTVAAVPGQWSGAASRAGLYYTPESKQWVDGLRVRIDPK